MFIANGRSDVAADVAAALAATSEPAAASSCALCGVLHMYLLPATAVAAINCLRMLISQGQGPSPAPPRVRPGIIRLVLMRPLGFCAGTLPQSSWQQWGEFIAAMVGVYVLFSVPSITLNKDIECVRALVVSSKFMLMHAVVS